jgi:phage tail sheath protein FI
MSSATYLAPGVYVEEVASAQQPIAGVGTNVAGFIGVFGPKIYIPVPNPDYDPVAARAAAQLKDLMDSQATAVPGAPVDPGREAVAAEAKAQAIAVLDKSVQRVTGALADLTKKQPPAQQQVDTTKTALVAAAQTLESVTAALNAATDDADRDAKKRDVDVARAAEQKADKAHAAAIKNLATIEQEIPQKQQELDELKEKLAAAKAQPAPAPAGGAEAAEGAAAGAEAPAAAPPAKTPSKSTFIEQEDADFEGVTGGNELLVRSILSPFVLQEFVIPTAALDTKLCTNFTEYVQRFGNFSAYKALADNPDDSPERWIFGPMHPGHHALTHALNGFFRNGGTKAFVARIDDVDQLDDALEKFRSIDELAIIAAPGLPKNPTTWEALMDHVEERENCFAILDSEQVVNDGTDNDLDIEQLSYTSSGGISEALPRPCKDAAFYFPHIEVIDPAKQLQDSDLARKVNPKYRGRTYVPPSGHIAGIYSLTDEMRGVHKAPANCVVRGAIEVKYYVSKPMQEMLNPQGVNAIRIMNGAVTVWGARTIGGDANAEWKYISVRRLFLFLQKSIEEGTQWIVFEPNDEALWAKIRLNISAFLKNVWRSGALFGATPEESFYVKCDAELNPPEVRDVGQVITEIGVAIVRPAEFVIFRITQSTGALQT